MNTDIMAEKESESEAIYAPPNIEVSFVCDFIPFCVNFILYGSRSVWKVLCYLMALYLHDFEARHLRRIENRKYYIKVAV